MPATYVLSTNVGKVRLLISDTNTAAPVFQDEEIDAFLALNVGVKRAAAAALVAIAGNEVQVSKILRTQDLATDAAKYADSMRALAAALRAEADRDDDTADAGGFDVVDFDPWAAERASWLA